MLISLWRDTRTTTDQIGNALHRNGSAIAARMRYLKSIGKYNAVTNRVETPPSVVALDGSVTDDE
jgi:hypothetical protein